MIKTSSHPFPKALPTQLGAHRAEKRGPGGLQRPSSRCTQPSFCLPPSPPGTTPGPEPRVAELPGAQPGRGRGRPGCSQGRWPRGAEWLGREENVLRARIADLKPGQWGSRVRGSLERPRFLCGGSESCHSCPGPTAPSLPHGARLNLQWRGQALPLVFPSVSGNNGAVLGGFCGNWGEGAHEESGAGCPQSAPRQCGLAGRLRLWVADGEALVL